MKKKHGNLLLVILSVLFAASFLVFAASCAGNDNGGGGSDSPTNVQEAGIDEGDLVKMIDGVIYKAQSDGVTVTKFDDENGTFTLLAKTKAKRNPAKEVLVYNDKLIVFYAAEKRQSVGNGRQSTCVEIYDVSAVNRTKAVSDLSESLLYNAIYPADLISSRLVEKSGKIYFFLQRNGDPSYYDIFTSADEDGDIVSTASDNVYVENGEKKTMKNRSVTFKDALNDYSPLNHSFLGSIDLSGETPVALSVNYSDLYLNDVYMSDEGIYGLTRNYTETIKESSGCYGSTRSTRSYFTTIVKLDTNDFTADAYALMRNFKIKDRLALKTANGYLYVAAEKTNGVGSTVVAFRASDMAIAGRAENLARGESLKSTTYELSDGKVYCYLVTYRNTDPLFRINVTDPDDMYEEGQLKMPGYSSYLYSYDKDYVIGLGYGGTSTSANTSVLKVALYYSDDGIPTEVSSYVVTGLRSCPALSDLHAFCVDRANGIFAVAASRSKSRYSDTYLQGAYLFRVVLDSDHLKSRLVPERYLSGHATRFGNGDTAEKDLTRILFAKKYYVGVSDGFLFSWAKENDGDRIVTKFCTAVDPYYNECNDPEGESLPYDSSYGTPFPEEDSPTDTPVFYFYNGAADFNAAYAVTENNRDEMPCRIVIPYDENMDFFEILFSEIAFYPTRGEEGITVSITCFRQPDCGDPDPVIRKETVGPRRISKSGYYRFSLDRDLTAGCSKIEIQISGLFVAEEIMFYNKSDDPIAITDYSGYFYMPESSNIYLLDRESLEQRENLGYQTVARLFDAQDKVIPPEASSDR